MAGPWVGLRYSGNLQRLTRGPVMTFVWRHPSYYKKLHKENVERLVKGAKQQATSDKPQASSDERQAPRDSSSKQQASSDEQQGSSDKPRAASSKISLPS